MWFRKIRRIGRRGWLLMGLMVTAVMLQSCLKNDEYVYDGYNYLQPDIETIKNYLDANNIDAEMDSAFGVFYKIHKNGDGYKTLTGIDVVAHYQGFTLDGDEFASTFDVNPVNFTIGDINTYVVSMTNAVSIGISFLHQGDSATIYVPSPYGFQDKSFQNVPPNSILVYNLKFEEIKKLDEEIVKIDQYIADNNISAAIDPEFGTRYAIHRAGNNITPEPGNFISTHYQGELLDGTVFDNSYDSNIPLDFNFGEGKLIIGFELGVSNLHENDSATIFIPSIYGYKDRAQGELIPANSVLIFGLDILEITK